MSKKLTDKQRRESFIKMNTAITESLGNTTTLPIEDRLFNDLPLDQQFACVFYRQSEDPHASTSDILDKVVAYVTKNGVRPKSPESELPYLVNLLKEAFVDHMKVKGAELSTAKINDLLMTRHQDIGVLLRLS